MTSNEKCHFAQYLSLLFELWGPGLQGYSEQLETVCPKGGDVSYVQPKPLLEKAILVNG
jgi:hypothetical protein